MTNNQTIDGVPRADLQAVYDELTDWKSPVAQKLRALLDADPIMCHGCMAEGVLPDHFDSAGKCEPAAQRKIDPVVSGWQLDSFDEKLEGLDPKDTSTLSNHDVAQLVCAVRTLQARQMTEPAAQPHGEPVDDCETFEYQLDMLGPIDRCNVSCGSYGDKYHQWDDAGPYVEYGDHVKHIELYKREVDRLSKL